MKYFRILLIGKHKMLNTRVTDEDEYLALQIAGTRAAKINDYLEQDDPTDETVLKSDFEAILRDRSLMLRYDGVPTFIHLIKECPVDMVIEILENSEDFTHTPKYQIVEMNLQKRDLLENFILGNINSYLRGERSHNHTNYRPISNS